MKKLTMLLVAAALLSGCETLSSTSDDKTPLTTSGKLKACALEEAWTKVQDGTAFTLGISEAADEISTTCVKKWALESAGLDTQATSDAYSALQSLMDTAKSITTTTTAE
jgi:hypothetical protein